MAKSFVPLEVTNAKELLSLDVPPLQYVISDLMTTGLHLLAGSPKIGKSWLALWLCTQIARGAPVWQFETRKCPTLYLSLEDTTGRLQRRLSSITEDGSENVWFATEADCLKNNLLTQLEYFLREQPGTGLIVIDTLACIRQSNETVNYSGDYEEIGKLKRFADQNGVALLLVHHLRKMQDDDPVNMISGSNGLTGAADTIYILQKDSRVGNKGTLQITGRDIPDTKLQLEFNRQENIWNFVSFLSENEPSPDARIIDAIQGILTPDTPFTGTATQLLDVLQQKDNSIQMSTNHLTRILREKSFILDSRGIAFSDKRSNKARTLSLSIADNL